MINALLQPYYISTITINKERISANKQAQNGISNDSKAFRIEASNTKINIPFNVDVKTKTITYQIDSEYKPNRYKFNVDSSNNGKLIEFHNSIHGKTKKVAGFAVKLMKCQTNKLFRTYAKSNTTQGRSESTKTVSSKIKLASIDNATKLEQSYNLIFMICKYLYLYLIAQIIIYKYKYKYKMNAPIDTIDINWKANIKTYNTLYKYFHWLNKNRIFFITWKLNLLLFKKKQIFKEISWHFAKRNNLYEKVTKLELEQEGIKIQMHIYDTDREYDTIWTIGRKICLQAKQNLIYLEIDDLMESNIRNKFPPKESMKFTKNILIMDEDMWIKEGIVANEYEKQLWQLLEEVEDEESDNIPADK